jgi:hypothetical protein
MRRGHRTSISPRAVGGSGSSGPSIQSLGAATVLCVDKTGTLTMNRMTVQRLFTHGESWDVSDPHGPELWRVFHELVEFSVLASRADTFDPMDIGIRKFGEAALAGAQPMNQPMHRNWSLVREYPLSSGVPAISEAWHSPEHQSLVIGAMGTPEAIANLCHLAPDESACRRRRGKVYWAECWSKFRGALSEFDLALRAANRGRFSEDQADRRISLIPRPRRRRSRTRRIEPSVYPTRTAISSTLALLVFRRCTARSTRKLWK